MKISAVLSKPVFSRLKLRENSGDDRPISGAVISFNHMGAFMSSDIVQNEFWSGNQSPAIGNMAFAAPGNAGPPAGAGVAHLNFFNRTIHHMSIFKGCFCQTVPRFSNE